MDNPHYGSTRSKPTTLAVFGFAILSVLFMPVFLCLSNLCALAYLSHPNCNAEAGSFIIILAVKPGIAGTIIGGWVLGLPKMNTN